MVGGTPVRRRRIDSQPPASETQLGVWTLITGCRRCEMQVYCAASLAIARSFAAVSSLSEVGCGMAITL